MPSTYSDRLSANLLGQKGHSTEQTTGFHVRPLSNKFLSTSFLRGLVSARNDDSLRLVCLEWRGTYTAKETRDRLGRHSKLRSMECCLCNRAARKLFVFNRFHISLCYSPGAMSKFRNVLPPESVLRQRRFTGPSS